MDTQSTSQSKTKILVVDDDRDLGQMVKIWLEGYFELLVIVATSGAMALSVAREHRPDMILMDLMMPRVNGIEATRQIKADEALRHIPVVLYSNNPSNRGWMEDAMAAGCCRCMDKMMTMQEMKSLIGSILLEELQDSNQALFKEKLIDNSPQVLPSDALPLDRLGTTTNI
jgi:CheY-like chemotaxis protein